MRGFRRGPDEGSHSIVTRRTLYTGTRYAIAAVWAINGLLCKLLHLVPRHEQIVARILGPTFAGPLTRLIGVGELLIAIWVASGQWSGQAVAAQVTLILTMNALEFALAPDLLLWGRVNLLFALLFSGFIVRQHQFAAQS